MEVARNTEDQCKAPIPEGLRQHLNKMLRAVLLSRPVQLNRFFAEYFEAELDSRTLSDLQSSDIFIKIGKETSERQKRGKSPGKSSTKPSAEPTTMEPKKKIPLIIEPTTLTTKPKDTKQMSGDDFDSEYYVNYYLTHETHDTSFDSGQSDAEYHEGHAFGDDDQIGFKRDSKYYMDYFLTHETLKRKPRTERHVAQEVFVPVQYDSDNFVDYFLTHETDPSISSFDQSDRDYSKAYCLPFKDASRRDSGYCRDYFLACEATEDKTFVSLKTEEKISFIPDYSGDNFVDYFLTHETDPRISSFGQSDRDYSKAYCLPFQDVSRRDSEYCRDYFLTCEATIEEKISSIPDYSGDNFVDYFLTHETDPRISSLGQSDRDYSKAYCLPFQDVSRRDSGYCRDYFLTCEATEETFVSEQTTALSASFLSDETAVLPLPSEPEKDADVLGEGREQQAQEDKAVASPVFTTFPSAQSFGGLEEPENERLEIGNKDNQPSCEDLGTEEEATPTTIEQKAEEIEETGETLCGQDESIGSMLSVEKSKPLDSGSAEMHESSSDSERLFTTFPSKDSFGSLGERRELEN